MVRRADEGMRGTRERAPSMSDVAALAGVSLQTVSRVLNGHANVSAQTASRVNAAIADLGYRRNTAARALVTRQSRTLGVVDFATTQVGPFGTIRAVLEAAQDADYYVAMAHPRNLSLTSVRRAIDTILEQGVDGLVLVAPHYEALMVINELRLSVPLVVVGARGQFDLLSVAVDHAEGARIAARHLLDLGHERLVHVSGPLDWLDASQRLEAWHREIQRSGVQENPSIVGGWGSAAGYERGMQILLESDVTGVFVSNDQIALGVLSALHHHGVRIPQDISVVGYGDTADAAFYEPPLTTVREDVAEVGQRAIDMLLDAINGGSPSSLTVKPRLVVRESTAPVPGHSRTLGAPDGAPRIAGT